MTDEERAPLAGVRRLLDRVLDAVLPGRAGEGTDGRSAQGEDDLSDVDVREALWTQLHDEEPGFEGIVEVFHAEGRVVYEVFRDEQFKHFQRGFTVTDDGEVQLAEGDPTEVELEVSWVPVAAQCEDGTCEGACRCASGQSENPEEGEEDAMDREQRIQALIDNEATPWTAEDQEYLAGLSDERFEAFEEQAAPEDGGGEGEPGGEPPAEGSTETEPAGEEPKGAERGSEGNVIEVDADTWQQVQRLAAREQRREAEYKGGLVKALTVGQDGYTPDELKAMDVDELEKLARACGIETEEPRVSHAGRAMPRGTGEAAGELPQGYTRALEKRRDQKGA